MCSCTLHGRHHFNTERFTVEMQRSVISNSDLKEIAQEQCGCQACELSIKKVWKKNNGEVYKLRKIFAVFNLFLCVVVVVFKKKISLVDKPVIGC